MKRIILLFSFLLVTAFGFSQGDNHHEIAIEPQAASFSTRGGTVGGGLKYAFVLGDDFAFGPSLRMQYLWSKNEFYGFKGSTFVWGGGVFAHYRFINWFFLGVEAEYLKNPYYHYSASSAYPEKKWGFTAFVGGGISKEWHPVRLNVGIYYDLVDGLRPKFAPVQSPLRRDYFVKVSNPQNPNYGSYIPMIYRIALFINLGPKKD